VIFAREAAIRSFSWSGICTRIEALLEEPSGIKR
jgi:hypothetical protein